MSSEANDWINFPQSSNEYARGVENYLDFAFCTRAEGDQISCPCKECYHRFWHRRDEVYNHLIANGIGSEIKEWHFNGKGVSSMSNIERGSDNNTLNVHDDIESLLYDTHRDLVGEFPRNSYNEIQEPVNAEAKKFFKLVEDGKQELYPGCKSFSKLSFIIRLYLFKCVHGLSNMAFDFEQTEETYLAEPDESLEHRIESMVDDNDDVSWCREGIPHMVIETNHDTFLKDKPIESCENESDLDGTDLEWIDS